MSLSATIRIGLSTRAIYTRQRTRAMQLLTGILARYERKGVRGWFS